MVSVVDALAWFPQQLNLRCEHQQTLLAALAALFISLGHVSTSVMASNDMRDSTITPVYVDDVWVANRVGFALETVGQRQYVAYYDRDRMMTVACRHLGEKQWRKTSLPNQLMWDSHNRVVLGIDSHGYIHVSGNMHVHPLCYFRSTRPYDIEEFDALPMTGRDEERVTYPSFFHDYQGDLLYSYRTGTCGNGNILVNRFEPEELRWVRHLDTPLFQGAEQVDSRAAYHRFVRDKQGNFHFVWMWRWTPLVETCHQLCYATSPDLIHWKNASGDSVRLPFCPDLQEVVVDDVPSQGGLHNSRFQIIVSPAGDPLIGYVKYDQEGMTQLYVAKHEGSAWRSQQISDWDFRWKFLGGGDQMSTGGSFRLAEISAEGVLVIPWSTELGTSGKYALDIETLQATSRPTTIAPRYPEAAYERLTNDPTLLVSLAVDQGEIEEEGVRYLLKWETRKGSHGKHAPKTIPKGPVGKLVVLEIR